MINTKHLLPTVSAEENEQFENYQEAHLLDGHALQIVQLNVPCKFKVMRNVRTFKRKAGLCHSIISKVNSMQERESAAHS